MCLRENFTLTESGVLDFYISSSFVSNQHSAMNGEFQSNKVVGYVLVSLLFYIFGEYFEIHRLSCLI